MLNKCRVILFRVKINNAYVDDVTFIANSDHRIKITGISSGHRRLFENGNNQVKISYGVLPASRMFVGVWEIRKNIQNMQSNTVFLLYGEDERSLGLGWIF